MQERRRASTAGLLGGLVLVMVGTVFLLKNAGVLDVDWSLLWPLILIGIGTLVIAGAFRARSGGWSGAGEQRVVVPVDGARRLELTMRLGAGTYRLRGGTASGLVEVTADQPTIASEVSRSGDLAMVRLCDRCRALGLGVAQRPRLGDRRRDGRARDAGHAGRSGQLPCRPVDAERGRGALPHRRRRADRGAARPAGEVAIRIDGGAASFIIAVPAGVQARVAASGLVATSGPLETPGYATATNRVTVTVTGGAASVRVTQAG